MTNSSSRLLLTLLLGICITGLSGQHLYPHSLAMGLKTSVAKADHTEINTPAISLDLNHQRNLTEFFSFRTGLMTTYMFPIQDSYSELSWPEMEPISYSSEGKNFHLGLTIMPMVYFRDEWFSLFVGLGGGIGSRFYQGATYLLDGGGNRIEEVFNSESVYFQLGWKPVIGASFKVGNSSSPKEVELSLSRESWWTAEDGNRADPFLWYGLSISFRHNFREG